MLAATAAGAHAGTGPGLVSDPSDTKGPLDVSGVRLEQDGGVLALTVRLRRAAALSALGVSAAVAVPVACVRERRFGRRRRLSARAPSRRP